MANNTCPFRMAAYRMLARLERAGLKDTMVYRMLANEQTRDLLTAESRLHLANAKAEPLITLLVDAGRSRPKRAKALAAIRAARTKVR